MKAHKPVKRKEAFTQEEVKILMEQLPDNKVGHTIRLMLATGMRTQGVLALEPQHIEPDGSCIHIRQAVNMVKGRPHIGPPKTANSVRDVPVPPSVRPCAVPPGTGREIRVGQPDPRPTCQSQPLPG